MLSTCHTAAVARLSALFSTERLRVGPDGLTPRRRGSKSSCRTQLGARTSQMHALVRTRGLDGFSKASKSAGIKSGAFKFRQLPFTVHLLFEVGGVGHAQSSELLPPTPAPCHRRLRWLLTTCAAVIQSKITLRVFQLNRNRASERLGMCALRCGQHGAMESTKHVPWILTELPARFQEDQHSTERGLRHPAA